MNLELQLETTYQLFEKDSYERINEYQVTIHKLLGRGATAIAYEASYRDKYDARHRIILKECFPKYLHLQRGEDGKVITPKEQVAQFEAQKQDFIATYKNNIMIQGIAETANSSVAAQVLLEGNNTVYMLTNYHQGVSYDEMQDEKLSEIIQTIGAICKIIGKYHEQGFLYLDLKPANIFKMPETNELVLLFDFGSVVRKEDIHSGKVRDLSYSKEWAAPELEGGRFRRISEATDLYAIGAMLFHKITGRQLQLEELMDLQQLDFYTDNPLFKTCSPKVVTYLKEIFIKTLNASVGRRYQSAKALEDKLMEVLEYAKEDYVYIKSNFAYDDQFFVGRAGEIQTVKETLKEKDVLFIHGFGGIGKSSIAKKYAKEHRSDYDTIVMINYTSNLKDAILSDYEIPLSHFERDQKEDEASYYKRKLSKIAELADSRTLFIIDNFDTEEDAHLQDLLSCGGKVLITTRTDFSDYNYPQIDVNQFEDINEVEMIFYKYNTNVYSPEDKGCIRNIIELVKRHTMTVELVAKLMRVTEIAPKQLYEKLCQAEGIANVGDDLVRQKKDQKLNKMSIMKHLKIIFNLSLLSDNQKVILSNLSLLSIVKINKDLFFKWIGQSYEDELKNLIERGWIQYETLSEKISLHQIVTDLTYEEEKPTAQTCESLTIQMGELARLRNYASFAEYTQRLKLCEIFDKRITGETLPLVRFYKNLSSALMMRRCHKAARYLKKAQKILDTMGQTISDEGAETYILEGMSYLKIAEDEYFEKDVDMAAAVNHAIASYNEALEITAAISNTLEDLTLAQQYIKVGKEILRMDQLPLYAEEEYKVLRSYCIHLFKQAVEMADQAELIDENMIKDYQKICTEASEFFNPHDYTLFETGGDDEELFLLYKQKAEVYEERKPDVIYVDAYEVNNYTLGEAAAQKGKLDEAISYYVKALGEGKNKTYSADEVLNGLIAVYLKKKDEAGAKVYIEALLNYNAEQNLVNVYDYYRIAKLYEDYNKETAMSWYKKVLEEVEEETLAEEVRKDIIEEGIKADLKLWGYYQEVSYLQQAMDYQAQYIPDYKKSYYYFGELFEAYATVYHSVAYYLLALEEYERRYASEQLVACAQKVVNIYGTSTMQEPQIKEALCIAYEALGKQASDAFDYANAYDLYGKAYALAKICYGERYYKTVQILDEYIRQGYYGDILNEEQKNSLYEACFYEEIAKYKVTQEEDQDQQHSIWQEAGRAYYDIGNMDKALECYEEAMKIPKTYHGTYTLEYIKDCYKEQGNYEKIEETLVTLIKKRLEENKEEENISIYRYEEIAKWYEELAENKIQMQDYEGAKYFYSGEILYYITLGITEEENQTHELLAALGMDILEGKAQLLDIEQLEIAIYYNCEDSIIEALDKFGEFLNRIGEAAQGALACMKASQIKNRYFEVN